MKPILEIRGISKKFQINKNRQSYLSLRDSISSTFKFSKSEDKDDFWALNDITFDVYPGESIGIIGKNGAGKSTLLKILSKITPPTTGKIISRGRIASLLEVGTGFHPELTGRENIFLNGSILGLKKSEIIKQFDEIVAFSGVEKFIDTPLKHFSSGMQLRLAFAVAAHLEPEILIIDEVLAVGDAEFQKKCIGKMGEVSRSGRTILFVSHNLNTIQSLCSKSVFIEKGRTEGITDNATAIYKYLYGGQVNAGEEIFEPALEKDAYILEARAINNLGKVANTIELCDDFIVELLWSNIRGIPINPSIELHSYNGVQVFWASDVSTDWAGENKKIPGCYKTRVTIPGNFLKGGQYFFRLGLYSATAPNQVVDMKLSVLHISIVDPMDERCLNRGEYRFSFEDFVVLPTFKWESIFLNN
jgi:lipopolysaccharide transport system ATP-binding protein